MNDVKGKSERIPRSSGLKGGAVLAAFALGVAVGVLISRSLMHNQLNLVVERAADVRPQVKSGDIVTWNSYSGGPSLTINFLGGDTLCTEGSGSTTCHVDGKKADGPYFYSCKSGTSDACPDPGIDKGGTTGPLEGEVSFAAKKSGPDVQATVVCNSSASEVDEIRPTAGTNPIIQVSPNQVIEWDSHGSVALDFSQSPQLCGSGSFLAAGQTQICAISDSATGLYNYTAMVQSTCEGSPQKEQINVTKKTVAN